MKSTIARAVVTSLIATLSLAPLASAHEVELGGDVKVNVDSGAGKASAHASATSSVKKDDDHGSATSTDHRKNDNGDEGNATSTDAKAKGQLNAEAHRSAVATFVKTLLEVADREDGIGAQVREVAKAQQDSASTTADAVAKVEGKSKWSTFFFGTDYKSLGDLKSELTTTTNNIEKLKKLENDALYLGDKTEIEAQIKTLEDSKAELTAFIDAHENTFSLFGWAVKLLSK